MYFAVYMCSRRPLFNSTPHARRCDGDDVEKEMDDMQRQIQKQQKQKKTIKQYKFSNSNSNSSSNNNNYGSDNGNT